MVEKEKQERFTSIDLMKFIAMFLVISYHCTNYPYDILDGRKTTYIVYLFRTLVSLGVPIFFFVNGYLLFQKEFVLKKHINKVIQLVLLTEIWNLLTLTFYVFLEKERITIRTFIMYLFDGRGGCTHHLWFMGALICVYIFYPLLKLAYDNNKKVFLYFCVVSFLLTIGNVLINQMGTIVNHVLRDGSGWLNVNWFKGYNPLRNIRGYAFVYFCGGGVMNIILPKIKEIPVCKRNVIAVCGLAISCLFLWVTGIFNTNIAQSSWDVVWYGYESIFTLVNVIFVFILCLNWKKDLGLIRGIATNTLGIYFVHENIRFVLGRLVDNYAWLNTFPMHILYTMMVLMISYFLTIIISKVPLVRRLIK